MSFTQKIIGPDEKLIGVARVHWVYGATGLMWLSALTVFGYWLDIKGTSFFAAHLDRDRFFAVAETLYTIRWICAGIGVILFALYTTMMVSTEIGLTSKRIIYKRGLFFVDVKEGDLEELKGVNVDHGYLGRFLNYGYLQFDARFVKDVGLPAVADPYRLVKALNEMRSRLQKDSAAPIMNNTESRARPETDNAKLEDQRFEGLDARPEVAAHNVAKESKEGAKAIKKTAPKSTTHKVTDAEKAEMKEDVQERFDLSSHKKTNL